ncbi:hypothetical protein FRB98_007128 [Tulasnella sp. 332]|nr:hypothetical protein FRB98_007128 [Tulasnella sp. 332]
MNDMDDPAGFATGGSSGNGIGAEATTDAPLAFSPLHPSTSIMPHPSPIKPPSPRIPSSQEQSSIHPLHILALLQCVYCNQQLNAPTTLPCGHTLCLDHLQPSPTPSPQVQSASTSTSTLTPLTASASGGPSRTSLPQTTNTSASHGSSTASLLALPACPLEHCARDQLVHAAAPIVLPNSSRVSYYPPPPPAASTSTSISAPLTEAGATNTVNPRGERRNSTTAAGLVGKIARERVMTPKQDVIVSKILQVAIQAQATRDAKLRLAQARMSSSAVKDTEGSDGSDDDADNDGDSDEGGGRGGMEEPQSISSHQVRIPSPGTGPRAVRHETSSSPLDGQGGAVSGSSRSVASRSSSQRSISLGRSTSASSRRRRHPTSSPDVSDEQPQESVDGSMESGSATRQNRFKAKKRKMASEASTTHIIRQGSDTGGGEGHGRSPSPFNPRGNDDAAFAKALKSEVQCEICFAMLYAPVTTPCQHTFCGKCLSRTLDHSTQCPLCRQTLPGYAYFHEHATNQVIVSVMLKAFPRAVADRKASIEQEEKNARLNTPLFVCQLSFPGLPTILHIFEPRCLQNPTPAFGMMMPPRTNGSLNDYGTMLEIRSVQMLPDGRSMVETKGTYRFRVLERGQLDGYGVGRVERIDDVDPTFDDLLAEVGAALTSQSDAASNSSGGRNHSRSASTSDASLSTHAASLAASASSLPHTTTSSFHHTPPPLKEPNVNELMRICRDFYDQLRSGTAPWVVQQLNNTYGAMPTDPSTFSFWMAVLLPIDENEKAKLLPIRSPRLRLKLIVHWIQTLNGSWWFSSGCVVC